MSLQNAVLCFILPQGKKNNTHALLRFSAALTKLVLEKVFVLPFSLLPVSHIFKPAFYAWLPKPTKPIFLSGSISVQLGFISL